MSPLLDAPLISLSNLKSLVVTYKPLLSKRCSPIYEGLISDHTVLVFLFGYLKTQSDHWWMIKGARQRTDRQLPKRKELLIVKSQSPISSHEPKTNRQHIESEIEPYEFYRIQLQPGQPFLSQHLSTLFLPAPILTTQPSFAGEIGIRSAIPRLPFLHPAEYS
jgi:hypothetical protein